MARRARWLVFSEQTDPKKDLWTMHPLPFPEFTEGVPAKNVSANGDWAEVYKNGVLVKVLIRAGVRQG